MKSTIEQRTQVTRSWLMARTAELRQRVRRIRVDLPGTPGATMTDILALALDELHYLRIAQQRLEAEAFYAPRA